MILEEQELDLYTDDDFDYGAEEDQELVIYQPSLLDFFAEDNQDLDEKIVLVNDPRWNDCLEEFKGTKIFGFDLETYGAEVWHPLFFKTNKIRLIQVGLPSGLCMIADLGGWLEISREDYNSWLNETYKDFLTVLGEKLEDNEVIELGVNLKFDFTTIRQHFGFVGMQARDLMIISQVVFAGVGVEKAKAGENRAERCKLPHGLKGIAERFGYEVDKTEQSSNWGWSLSTRQLNYAASDVLILFPLYEKLKALVLQHKLQYTAFVECNAVSVFAEMEFMGVPINLELAKQMLLEYEEKRDEWVQIFNSYFPDVQWTSNPQVLEAFTEKLDEFNKLFEDGTKPSVSAEVLYQLEHPAAEALHQARVLNTACNNIKVYINNSFGGSIRGFYRQIAPGGSGRSTCSAKLTVNRKSYLLGAQLQNPPNAIARYKGILKPVREIIQAPEGYSFGVFDGAQMHMRIAAEVSQDPILLRIFRDDFDGHSILAAKLAEQSGLKWSAEFISGTLYKGPRDTKWEVEMWQLFTKYGAGLPDWETWLSKEVSPKAKDFRNKSKTCVYSCLNGSTAGRITQSMVSDGLEWFTFQHGKELFNYFREVYKLLNKFIADQYDNANSVDVDFSGFKDYSGKPIVGKWGRITSLTGRHIYYKKYPSRFDNNKMEVSYTDATSANWLLPEADMIKHWAVEVFLEFRRNPHWGAYIANIVHDELDLVFKTEYAEEIAPMVRHKMKEVFGKWLRSIPPLEEADPKQFICKSWAEK